MERAQRLRNRKFMEKLTVICPCCESTLTIDAATGAILAHEEKKKAAASFDDLKEGLSKQKELRDQLFFTGNVFDEGSRTASRGKIQRSDEACRNG